MLFATLVFKMYTKTNLLAWKVTLSLKKSDLIWFKVTVFDTELISFKRSLDWDGHLIVISFPSSTINELIEWHGRYFIAREKLYK